MQVSDLLARYGAPSERAVKKQLDHIDSWCRRFIEMSPFVVLGTSDADGRQDVSPRGDPPGFVRILDEKRLFLPDRPGNRRLDSLQNITVQPQVGLLFLVPGFDETVRVNGRARITIEPDLLAGSEVDRRPPISGLLIEVEEVYFHCGKAMIRSRLWKQDAIVDRKVMPGLGRIVAEQIGDQAIEAAEAAIKDAYQNKLY